MTATSAMTSEQQALNERIRTFPFDDGPVGFLFAARLARDNGWSAGFTARVVTEYRRFVFLAVAARHPVSPSDQVDQVWHLHLLYTESYWIRFCRETLGTPLHHHPTEGGSSERKKFENWYGKTLDSYHHFFGTEAPPDIWPERGIRFGEDIHFRRVNTKRCWILPKPWAKGARR